MLSIFIEYYQDDQIKEDATVENVARMVKFRNSCKGLIQKWKCHLEDIGEYQYFKEGALKGVDWINVAQNMDHWQALMNAVMNLGSHKGRESLDQPCDH